MDRVIINRRRFLKAGSGLVAAAAVSPLWAKQALHVENERFLHLYNLHTGEQARSVYWAQGHYLDDQLDSLSHILRDHHNGAEKAIDRALLDLLHDLTSVMDYRKPLHVISGYRSPQTNAKLRARSQGVAKQSLHMQGKAIDLRLPGVSLDLLHNKALSLRAGGVGYYRRSNFIHLDVGRVRNWRG